MPRISFGTRSTRLTNTPHLSISSPPCLSFRHRRKPSILGRKPSDRTADDFGSVLLGFNHDITPTCPRRDLSQISACGRGTMPSLPFDTAIRGTVANAIMGDYYHAVASVEVSRHSVFKERCELKIAPKRGLRRMQNNSLPARFLESVA